MPRYLFGLHPNPPQLPQPAPYGDERSDIGPLLDTLREIWEATREQILSKIETGVRDVSLRPLVRVGLVSGNIFTQIIADTAAQNEEWHIWEQNRRVVSGYETRERILQLSALLGSLWQRFLTGAPNQPMWTQDP